MKNKYQHRNENCKNQTEVLEMKNTVTDMKNAINSSPDNSQS